MLRKSVYLLHLMITLLYITSCKEEETLSYSISSTGSVPVEFEFSISSLDGTRALEGTKTNFIDGDIIHIVGHFTNESGGMVDSYGCMRLENGKFKAVDGSLLVWPDQATKGYFEAYFIDGSTGILTEKGQTQTTSLSSLTLQTDPLYAKTSESVVWGHAVTLQFTHALTYLQLVNLEPGISDRFLFSKTGINNVFFLQRIGNELSLKFDRIPNQQNGEVSISRNVVNVNDEGILTSQVSYFLQPGDYTQFELKTQNEENYLYFNNNVTSDLQANHPYILDIKKSQGVTIYEQDNDDWVDDEENWNVDVGQFLDAVVNGKEYYNDEGQQILAQTQSGTELLHNITFNFFRDYEKLGFEPSIPSGIVFDGGKHYIFDVGYPIFRYNNGTIQDLGIKTIRADVVSEEHNESIDNIKDRSRQGGLCCYNQPGGTIQNVRVKDLNLIVHVKSKNSQESHNLGCLVGSNAGTIIDLSVYGDFSLTIDNESEEVSARVYMGGIVGQNLGTISGVKELDGDNILKSLTVTNKCTGNNGAFYLGGVSGQNSQVIDQVVLPNVAIDSRQSLGSVCYVGGLVGRLDSEAATNVAVLQSSTVSGVVYGGNCRNIGDNSSTYAAGIAGGVYNVSVSDCRSICSVSGFDKDKNEGVAYFTGGAFGRIFTTSQTINNITSWGSVLTGATGENCYIGNFAGAIPLGQTYVQDYEPYKMLINEIVEEMVGGNY